MNQRPNQETAAGRSGSGEVDSLCAFVTCACPALLIGAAVLLSRGYGDPTLMAARGATPDDFMSVGNKCLIEGIDYQNISKKIGDSSPVSGSGLPIYSCEESWQYDFAVLENYDPTDDADADYVMRSVTEHRTACDGLSCLLCADVLGKYALNHGEPITNGNFTTECWVLKDGVRRPHPFWNCRAARINNGSRFDTACYLMSNPGETLNDQLKTPRRDIKVGWALFATGALALILWLVLLSYLCKTRTGCQQYQPAGH